MELEEFKGLALRTESQIEGIKLNRENVALLLRMFVSLSEVLDGLKKAAFYNKTEKLDSEFSAHLSDIAKAGEKLAWSVSGRGVLGTLIDSDESVPNVSPRVFHGILGILTESGELGEALLKSFENGDHVIDAVNVQEEMSDIAWYEAILHDELGLNWEQGLVNVIEKLRIRYPDKYSDYAAANRNLAAERAALEVGVPQVALGLEAESLLVAEVAEELIADVERSGRAFQIGSFETDVAGEPVTNAIAIPLNWGTASYDAPSEDALAELIDKEARLNQNGFAQEYLLGKFDPK